MKRAWVLAFMLGLAAAPLGAQTPGSIEGVVTDEKKVPVPGVTVEAMSASLQGTRTAATDVSGKFRLLLLPPGRYSVRFALAGFTTIEQTDIAVGLGRSMTLQVQMRSTFKEEVRVTGEAPSGTCHRSRSVATP